MPRPCARSPAEGPDGFYKGEIAQAIVDKVQHAPHQQGGMTLADLANYQAKERAPVCGDYRQYRISAPWARHHRAASRCCRSWACCNDFRPTELTPGTVSGAHLFAEASRLAYADRAQYLGDPAFVDVPVRGLTDKGYVATRAALIDPAQDMGTAVAGDPPQKHAELSPQSLAGAARHQPHDHRG